MPSITIHNFEGKAAGNLELPESLFGVKVNSALMAQAVRVYLSNQRHAVARTKDRGEIDRTKAKWFRQKGTGRARHGSRSAALFVGGYKAHGPAGTQNYRLKMSQKMRQAALKSALTTKLQDQQIMLLAGLDKLTPKTREAWRVLKNLKLDNGKIMVVMPEKIETVIRAFRNLPNVSLELASDLNTYTTLNAGMMVFTKEGIEKLTETLSPKPEGKKEENKVASSMDIEKPATAKTTAIKETPAIKAAKPEVKKTAAKKTVEKKTVAKAKSKVTKK